MYLILFIHELFIHIVLSNQRVERFQTNFDQLEFSIHSNEILVNWSRTRAYRRKIIGCFNLHEFLSLTIEEENESTSILPFLIPTLRIFNQTLSTGKLLIFHTFISFVKNSNTFVTHCRYNHVLKSFVQIVMYLFPVYFKVKALLHENFVVIEKSLS